MSNWAGWWFHRFVYEQKQGNGDFSDIIHLMKIVTTTSDAEFDNLISDVIDVHRVLRVVVVHVLTNNFDGYIGQCNNFELYYDTKLKKIYVHYQR